MVGLEVRLNDILNEKDTKIKPENIKSGVRIFDITGSYGPDYNSLTEMIIAINGEEAQ